jgi:protein SCO1
MQQIVAPRSPRGNSPRVLGSGLRSSSRQRYNCSVKADSYYLKWALAVAFVFVGGSTFWVLQQKRVRQETLPVYSKAVNFQMVDQNGEAFQSDSLRGSVTLVNFIFTSCPSVCPLLTRQMKAVQEATKGFKPPVRLVSISVDPERDTPTALKAYGTREGADFSRWTFLTGPLQTVRKVVVEGFMNALGEKTPVQGEPDLYDIVHGRNFVVLDANGNIRAFRQLEKPEAVADLVTLLKSLSKSSGAESHSAVR